jgi:rfaE bifunctional protein kinase chain/domain
LAGVIGPDDGGLRLREKLTDAQIGCDPLVQDPSRVTTVKTRVTVGGQQIVRFDDEDITPVRGQALEHLQACCTRALDAANVCVISDYAKGVVTPSFCAWLIAAARHRNLPIVVDPKSSDLTRYRGASVITPNLKETAAATGELLQTSGLQAAVGALLPSIAPSALLVTRGEEGMSLFESGAAEWHMPAMVNEVADVTGAGDTVVGVLAVALGAGFSLQEAAALANLAAGVAVGHHGTWAVTGAELLEAASRLQA